MSDHRKIPVVGVLLILFSGSSILMPARALAQSLTYTASPPERKPSNPPAEFITVGTTKLHYVEAGSGKPVVLIHGNAGDLHDFEFRTMDLIARDYHAVAFDLPGHGLSETPKKAKGTIEESAAILHEALKQMGIKDPILVGHSWGGAVALAYALHYPKDITGLVLLAPAAYPDHRRETKFEGLGNVPVLGDLFILLLKPLVGRKVVEHGLRQAFFPDKVPEGYRKAATASWLGRKQIKACIQNDLVLESSLSKQSGVYETIHAPVIIVTGDSDQAVSPAQNAYPLHQAITKSELLVIPNAGHQIPETHPEAVLRAIQMVRPASESASIGSSDENK